MTQNNQNEIVVNPDATCNALQSCIRNNPNAAFEFVVATHTYYNRIKRWPLVIKASKLAQELDNIACSHESCTQWPKDRLPNLVEANVGEILEEMTGTLTCFGVHFVVAHNSTCDPEIIFFENDQQKEPLATILSDPDVLYNYIEALCAFDQLYVKKPRIIRASHLIDDLIQIAWDCETCPMWLDENSPLRSINEANIEVILNATKEDLKGFVNFWVLPDHTDNPDIFFYHNDPLQELAALMNDPKA